MNEAAVLKVRGGYLLDGGKYALAALASPDAVIPDGKARKSESVVWETDVQHRVRTYSQEDNSGTVYTLTRDGKRRITSSLDDEGAIWDVDTGAKVAALDAGAMSNCTLTKDGTRLIVYSSANTLQLWDMARKAVITI